MTPAFWKRAIIITITGANLLIFYYNCNYFRRPVSHTSAEQPAAHSRTPANTPTDSNSKPQQQEAVPTPTVAVGPPPATAGPTQTITIKFESNRLDLSPTAQADLHILFKTMSGDPTLKVEIGGHTDNVGNPMTNVEVSVKRATIVGNYLVKLGVPSDRIIIRGYGEIKPIADNKTEDGRAQNRRVEIIPFKD